MPEKHLTQPRLRIAHLTTVDMSLALLLGTELAYDLDQGHTVFGVSAPGPYVERVEAMGVTHVPITSFTRSWSLGSDLRAFLELLRTLRRLDLDVLHTHTPKAGVMGRIAGRLAGVPVVVNTCHGLWARPDDPLAKRAFVYGLEALAVRFSHYELFQNAQDARTMRRFLKPGRWKVVGNGIDLQRFRPDPEGRARVRAEWGVRDDQLVVGTIGRRVREKGLAEFAEAAHRLGDRAVFVWVGPEDATDAAAQVPHQDAIRFVGERSDMPAVYSALDVFALPSYREGFSRASMEAAACGLPLVLSDIRGCREIGTDGEHLLLVAPRDADALTAGIERLLGDAALRAALGAAARRRATEEFDQRAVARASLDAYALARSGRRAAAADATNDAADQRTLVLHVLPQDLNRGAQVYAGRLRDALRDDPEQNHLVVTLFDGPEGAARPDITLGAPASPARRVVDPVALGRLRRLIRRRRPALVVAHGGEALKYVIPAAGRTPTVYYKVGLSSAELARRSRTALYGALARRATRVVAVSSDVARQLEGRLGVQADRIDVIPNGRDPQVYHPAAPGLPQPEPPRVLWIGQFERGKRPDLFLDVIATLRDRGVAFDAAMVGSGPLLDAVRARAGTPRVELFGSRSDVPDLLQDAALLVMTSEVDTEGMPGVLIEAALSGVPVVSTAAAGVADVVADGSTGVVVPESPTLGDALAAAVEGLLADREKMTAMGEAARELGVERFSLQSTTDRWRVLVRREAR